jgi:hypothetical protein
MCARQYTFFYKTASYAAFYTFHTDARSLEATLLVPRTRSAFYAPIISTSSMTGTSTSSMALIIIIMFYIRMNKIKIFNNREGFLGLFNRAEMRIYSYATALFVGNGLSAGLSVPPLTLAAMLSLIDEHRKEKLLETVQTEIYRQTTLNRAEHYPHGARDRQDTADTTGNILVDYTLFGFENIIDPPASDVLKNINLVIMLKQISNHGKAKRKCRNPRVTRKDWRLVGISSKIW